MSRRYKFTTTLTMGMDAREYEVTVSYQITKARGVTPPSYASGGSPAEDAGIEDIDILTIDGKEAYNNFDTVFTDAIEERFESGEFNDQMMDNAAE